jgi:hypothetical protein
MENTLKFATHPLKADIVARWDRKESNKSIHEWLEAEHPTVVLSIPTLCMHYARYVRNKRRLESSETGPGTKEKRKKRTLPIEEILWETITQCRQMKKDATISVKDWQYVDQQMQAALEKLMRIQESGGDTRDISNILSEIFAKLELTGEVAIDDVVAKELSEEDKLKIAQTVDNDVQVEPTIPPATS